MMLLTDAERQKFADYLELDATSTEGIVAQMKKLPGGVMLPAIRKYEAEAAAARVVAAKLRSMQSQTLGG